MQNQGFVKVATGIPHVTVADCHSNAQQIEDLIVIAEKNNVEVIVFPELCMTGYTCADLFAQQLLLEEAERGLMQVLNDTRQLDIISILGMPIDVQGQLLNTAVVIQRGKILGVIPKTFLPNYREFQEQRWFTSASNVIPQSIHLCGQATPLRPDLLFKSSHCTFGVEICEDLWSPIPPSSYRCLQGAELIFNLSADNEGVGKHAYLCSLIEQQSARCIAGYAFASCGAGESTTDLVFAGKGLIYENGTLLAQSARFSLSEQLAYAEIDVERIRAERRINTTFSAAKSQTITPAPLLVQAERVDEKELKLSRSFPATPFVPSGEKLNERCEELFSIQMAGLAQRLIHTHAQSAVIGISGGLDSTLALLVCVKTYDKLGWDRKKILGITMPGFGTTDRTYQNAIHLMQSLGVSIREISIKEACIQHFKDIEHDASLHDVTYENSQARERTQILMDVANQTGGLVIGTGDLSELALGWATYNGDQMSMYGVNASVPKTLVKHLVAWVANHEVDESSQATLLDIVDTPISPELIPADENGNILQKTEDLVGPYELHDFFLYYFLRFGFRPSKIFFLAQHTFADKYERETIKKWLSIFFRRFFQQQFKRSCLPDGPKVGSISISPRGDWRMPSDANSSLWLKEIESLL